MKNLIYLSFFILLITIPGCKKDSGEQYVVILSLDGFRWDYAQYANTPNLDRIAREGVMAESLKPCFPSKTFPNHYSIATGLYPDHHGIVLNEFYDSIYDVHYSPRNRDAVEDGRLYGGEPIWVTAEMQGVKSASFFWVGSEADVKGIRPTYWKRYDHYFPYDQRIDSVVAWLELPDVLRPRLILWYYDQPDGIAHMMGPENDTTYQMIEYLDSLLGVFLNKIDELPFSDKINIIVTSDHGMGSVSEERLVLLEDYIKDEWVEMIKGGNPVYNIKAAEGCIDSIMNALESVDHISSWKKGEVPEALHYSSHSRLLDICIAADSSYSVRWGGGPGFYSKGAHGYDNRNKDMHGIFYATGPVFKESYRHPTFENIHIYSIMAEILHLQPAPTDGNLETVRNMLR